MTRIVHNVRVQLLAKALNNLGAVVKIVARVVLVGTMICGAGNRRATAQSVQTLGAPLCVGWINGRRAPSADSVRMLVEGWALGYVSGLAVASRRNIAAGLSMDDIFGLIDDECQRGTPQTSVMDVLNDWSRGRRP
jgi:hypothetical protein